MNFRGWKKTSLIEYPGRISTVLFTGSCNFRCPFCYNRDLVLSPEKLPLIKGSEVLEYLAENRNLYHAVVFTGGEPTINKDLPEFLGKVKKLGYLVGIETNGTNPQMLEKLIKNRVLDFVGMDIKAPLTWDKYKTAAGIKSRRLFENVKKSVRILLKSGIDYEFRTTVVPGIHEEKDIVAIAGQLKGAKRYVLQQFLPKNTIDEKFCGLTPFPDKTLVNLRKRIKGNFGICEIRNI